jgi:hypothetical protein
MQQTSDESKMIAAHRLLAAVLSAAIMTTGIPLRAAQGTAAAQAAGTQGQTTPVPAQTAPRKTRRKRHPASTTAGATGNDPGAPGEKPEQKAQDQRLLQQQTTASQAAKHINDQQVQQHDAQQQKVQSEPRIQDAPPTQAGPPSAAPPASGSDQRIQDAPGPAQTNPPAQPAPPPQG